MNRILAILLLCQVANAANVIVSGKQTLSGNLILSGAGVVIPAPTNSFTTSATSGDPSLSVTFTDTSTGNPTSWLWNFGDGSATVTNQNPTHSFASGLWTVTSKVSNLGGNSTATTNITVNFLADIFVDFHAGANGQAATTNLLTSSSFISTNYSQASWTFLGGQSGTNLPTSTTMFFTNVNAALPAPVKVDGVSHSGNDGIGIAYYFNGGFEQYGQLNWVTNYPNVSGQCIMSFGEANGNWFDHGALRSTTNSSVQCSFPNYKSGNPSLQTETCPSPNPCIYGPQIIIARNTNYRITFKWVSGDGGYLSVYTTGSGGGTLVGTSYSSNDSIAGGVGFFQLGIPSSSDGGNTVAYWDSLAIKFDTSLYQ